MAVSSPPASPLYLKMLCCAVDQMKYHMTVSHVFCCILFLSNLFHIVSFIPFNCILFYSAIFCSVLFFSFFSIVFFHSVLFFQFFAFHCFLFFAVGHTDCRGVFTYSIARTDPRTYMTSHALSAVQCSTVQTCMYFTLFFLSDKYRHISRQIIQTLIH